jgi:hypothetical protein
MKSVLCAASLAFASMLAVSAPQPALAESQIEIAYEEPASAELRPIYEQLMALGVLQQLQLFMEPLRLPKPLKAAPPNVGRRPNLTARVDPSPSATRCSTRLRSS